GELVALLHLLVQLDVKPLQATALFEVHGRLVQRLDAPVAAQRLGDRALARLDDRAVRLRRGRQRGRRRLGLAFDELRAARHDDGEHEEDGGGPRHDESNDRGRRYAAGRVGRPRPAYEPTNAPIVAPPTPPSITFQPGAPVLAGAASDTRPITSAPSTPPITMPKAMPRSAPMLASADSSSSSRSSARSRA